MILLPWQLYPSCGGGGESRQAVTVRSSPLIGGRNSLYPEEQSQLNLFPLCPMGKCTVPGWMDRLPLCALWCKRPWLHRATPVRHGLPAGWQRTEDQSEDRPGRSESSWGLEEGCSLAQSSSDSFRVGVCTSVCVSGRTCVTH